MNASSNRSRPDGQPRADSELPEREVEETWYRTPRLTLPIPGVREFQSRYEGAVPDLPLAAVEDLVSRNVPWSEMVELIERSAPRAAAHGHLGRPRRRRLVHRRPAEQAIRGLRHSRDHRGRHRARPQVRRPARRTRGSGSQRARAVRIRVLTARSTRSWRAE